MSWAGRSVRGFVLGAEHIGVVVSWIVAALFAAMGIVGLAENVGLGMWSERCQYLNYGCVYTPTKGLSVVWRVWVFQNWRVLAYAALVVILLLGARRFQYER